MWIVVKEVDVLVIFCVYIYIHTYIYKAIRQLDNKCLINEFVYKAEIAKRRHQLVIY